MTKHTKTSGKKWKNHNFLLNGKNPLFYSFSTFFGMFGDKKIFLQFSWLIFKWETKFSLGILWPNPISSILFSD